MIGTRPVADTRFASSENADTEAGCVYFDAVSSRCNRTRDNSCSPWSDEAFSL